MNHIHVCRFSSGLDELPPKLRNVPGVLRVMERHGRFSTFEVTKQLAGVVDHILDAKLVEVTGGEYPWTTVRLTDKGRKAMGEI